jgi:subtilisin family serine protease
MKKIFPLFLILLSVAGCGDQRSYTKRVQLDRSGDVQVVVTGVENVAEIRREASALGIAVTGDRILIVRGLAEDIGKLEFRPGEGFAFIEDEAVGVDRPQPFTPDAGSLYLAKKDFGLFEFWKRYPDADGRNVTVAVIDDGISPHQHGFRVTSTGERKFLKKESQSTFSTFDLVETADGFEALVDESRVAYEKLDLNADGAFDSWKLQVRRDLEVACVDVNKDGALGETECAGSFAQTGGYVELADARLVLMFEIDKAAKKIRVFQPERGADSHGEGVASVLAGHRIGDLPGFDGVAPGAKIVDYDLSEHTEKASEREFTLGTFLLALDWAGKNGAEVANISYSLFFTSARSQMFMARALDDLVKKYNMVVSFSAGNNGPGLGSLNRRGIYPNSVLVAGAFISKELDERVHGVTGIPEEGRVVYYSSRGPGLGVGPTVIAPLSSLTNSAPDGGHRGFNGTSSAAPALAGAATVLVSAIKQANLRVDAATVVHALRLSGRRLKNEPFIFQGMGLPQVEDALAIYRDLVAGKKPIDVTVAIERDQQDGVAQRGIFLKRSEVSGTASRRLSLTAVMSALAPASARVNLLTPVKLGYSAGITGPRELWVSASASTAFVDVNVDSLLGDDLEAFGEIRISSALDNALLAIVPVTAVNDQSVLLRPSAELAAGPQEGLRFPLFVPAGVRGFRVRADVLDGDERTALLSIFDPNGIRTVQQRLAGDLWVATPVPGFYQVGLAMAGGTERGLRVRLSADPLALRLRTRAARADEPAITVTNGGLPLNAQLKLTPVPVEIEAVFLTSKDLENVATVAKDLTEGSYRVDFQALNAADLSYVYATCTIREEASDGKVKLTDGMTFTVPASGTKATIRCMPFDKGGVFGDATIEWQLRLLKEARGQTERLDVLRDQSVTVKFPKASPGRYRVDVLDPFTGTAVEVGEIDLD